MKLTYEGGGWDRNGGLYRGEDNELYRIIAPHMRDFYCSAIANREIQALAAEGKLVPSKVAHNISGCGSLALRHEVVPLPTYPFEWTQEMFIRAAKLTIEVCERLIGQGMCLQDASFWNILFCGRRPIFVDFTSIVPFSDEHFDAFVRDFRSEMLSCLDLIRDGHITLLRRLSRDYGKSISADVAHHIVPRASAQSRLLAIVDDLIVMPTRAAARKVRRRCVAATEARGLRKLATVEKRLRQLSEVLPKRAKPIASEWGSYYSGQNGFPAYDGTSESLRSLFASDGKHRTVAELIEAVAPKRFVDLGCNRGPYAHFASLRGAASIGIDRDEEALDIMFADGEQLSSHALPCFADVAAPAAPLGPPGKNWPRLSERCRGDMALCLALVHHLLLGSPQISTAALAELLSDYTTDWLNLEFVGPEDPFLRQAYGVPPATYCAANILNELERYFRIIERRPTNIPTREIFICRRRYDAAKH